MNKRNHSEGVERWLLVVHAATMQLKKSVPDPALR